MRRGSRVDDLAAVQADWVAPLRTPFAGATVCELPPNGQGAAASRRSRWCATVELGGRGDADRVHLQAEAMKLAFADAYRYIADQPLPAGYLDERLPRRAPRADRPRPGRRPGAGGAAAWRHRLPVGGGPRPDGLLVHPEPLHPVRVARGRARHGRDAAEPRRLLHARARPPEPARAGTAAVPHHHPGDAARRRRPGRPVRPDGRPRPAAGPPPAGHEPAAARARAAGGAGRAPRGGSTRTRTAGCCAWSRASGTSPTMLERRGHRVWRDPDPTSYGGGQAIIVRDGELVGGSEPRKDGVAAGY